MAADKKRGAQAVRDMIISLAVIVLAAWVIYLFIPHDDKKDPVKPVSYTVELNSARRAAPYPVAAPEGLSKNWRATSVRYAADSPKGSAWHLGFMTPDNEYATVEQTDKPRPQKFIEDVTQGAEKTAKTQRVGGDEWTRYEGEKYDALVRTFKNGKKGTSVTVVTGTASFKQLGQLAGALQAKNVKVETGSPAPQKATAADG
ncbi:DUF4245 domain-containing protein [Streptomyces iconiensis]|uniref:DUF4245 domain-containing protein n=1 Tax=Streptomyces iconiensis TaxID=1384038 RepID=A0ABT7A0P6_9ACTN|nr:DUF4245 domain-containing protein [Streptomyces iconiensis]MDJ1134652.1 DUF4245 domain-containing protein [Streptomyces iconiensis]